MILTFFSFLIFVVIVCLGYFAIPQKSRWVWLLVSSLGFYFTFNPICCLLLVFCAFAVYLFSVYCQKLDDFLDTSDLPRDDKKILRKKTDTRKKITLTLLITVFLALIVILRPSTFIVSIGLSFFVFTAIGYAVDVYRGTYDIEKNPFKLLLFLSFFPRVLQGPIDRYDTLAPSLFEGHSFDLVRVTKGIRRMMWGFLIKLVIADNLARVVNLIFDNSENYNGIIVLISVILYAFQIYADFKGYMDIMSGTSQILGITISENFDAPYLSTSVPEFWRRWHITLGSWFRDYLFYPVMRSALCKKLSKSLKKKYSLSFASTVITCIALSVIWFSTGLWHGLSLHYIVWGVYYGILIILSTITKPRFDKLNINRQSVYYKLFATAKTFVTVLIGYIFFRAHNMSHAFTVLSRIVTGLFTKNSVLSLSILTPNTIIIVILGVLVLIVSDILKHKKISVNEKISTLPTFLNILTTILIISAVILLNYLLGHQLLTFIYFLF